MQQTGLKCAISPLHDRDKDPDGNQKKPHRHVIICYDGPQTYNAVKTLTESLRQPIPQPVESVRGYYRYLCHLDNPEKAQYSKADIETINGFDIRDYVELTKTEVVKILGLIQDFIRDSNIMEYSDLLDYLHDGAGMEDWYEVAVSHTLVLTAYLRSRREKGRIQDDGKGKK